MTDFHLGPLFRFIPNEEPPTSEYLFTWPKIFFDLIYPVSWEDHGEFISDVLYEVEFWEGAESETPEFTEPYDYYFYFPDDGGFWSFAFYRKPIFCSLVLRADDYPITPDLPGTGTVSYTSHSEVHGRSIDKSATINRRCLTVELPAPQFYVGPPAPSEGNYIEENRVIYTTNLIEWYRNPTTHDMSGPGGSEIPQSSREYRRNWANYRYNTIGYPQSAGVELPYYYLPNGTGRTLLTSNYLADQGTFTMSAEVTDYGLFTKTYALNKIVTNGLGIPATAEFWILNGDPDVYG